MLRVALCMSLIYLAGCSSFKSTLLTRNEANTCYETTPRLKGVPITVKVPTHLKVTVVERHMFHKPAAGSPAHVASPVVIRDLKTEIVRTEKLFTVDFKRPAAGTIDLTAEFTEDQYFSKIQDKITDETIDDVANLLSKTLPLLTPTSGNGEGEQKGPDDLIWAESVVAVGLFEFDEPDFEERVMGFVNCHVNNAHNALMVPPGVQRPVRLPEVPPIRNSSCGPPHCEPQVEYLPHPGQP